MSDLREFCPNLMGKEQAEILFLCFTEAISLVKQDLEHWKKVQKRINTKDWLRVERDMKKKQSVLLDCNREFLDFAVGFLDI